MANRALSSFGAPHAITVNVGRVVSDKAGDEPRAFLDYVRRSIKRQLDRKLERSVEFWAVAERTPDGRLHIHGGVALRDAEKQLAEAAVDKAAGEWDSARSGKRKIKIKPQTDMDGWARYSFKRAGSVPTITNPLRGVAKNLYRIEAKIFLQKHDLP
jgi:hypothetical protein